MNDAFRSALTVEDIGRIRAVPKSDLHNHGMLGGDQATIETFYGRRLPPFIARQRGIADLNRWIFEEFKPFFDLPGAYEKAIEATFVRAVADGIRVLEMSIDVFFNRMAGVTPRQSVDILRGCHRTFGPDILFYPEIGFPRTMDPAEVLTALEPYFSLGYFRSVDMYDDENARPVVAFREVFRIARNLKMRCKAHAGEFGNAGSVREAVEELDLDAVQHGIGAASDPDVMRYLAARGVLLNVCPTSNIKLLRISSYQTHPIRKLFDHGVKVTINTDDALIFGDGNSEQYLKLYKAGLFSAGELDEIRLNGLGHSEIT